MKSNYRFVVLILIMLIIGSVVEAQCPMCRMSAESNLKNGGTEGTSLNAGILYLLSLPYLAILVFAFIWIRYKRQKRAENSEIS